MKTVEAIKAILKDFDLDGDGFLTPDEVSASMHSGRIASKESDCPLGLISLKLARNPFLKASYLGKSTNNQKNLFIWVQLRMDKGFRKKQNDF